AEESETHATQTVDTPHTPRARRPPERGAAPMARAVAAGAPGAPGGRVAGGGAAAAPVGHGPGCAPTGAAVAARPDLVPAASRLLGTPGADLVCAGAHGRGRRGAPCARGGGGAGGTPDPRASGRGRAGCGWRAESERARGLSRAPQGHCGRRIAKIFELIFPRDVTFYYRLRCGLSSASLCSILSLTMDSKA